MSPALAYRWVVVGISVAFAAFAFVVREWWTVAALLSVMNHTRSVVLPHRRAPAKG